MIINIDNLLKEKAKTRYWLAKQIGITYPTMAGLANGITTSIKFDTMENICRALECTPNDLFSIPTIDRKNT